MSDAGLRWRIDGYEEWLSREALSVVSGLAIDLMRVETRFWPRLGADAVVVHADARGDFANLYICDLAVGAATEPQRHLYEAVVYVLDGVGSTLVDLPTGRTHTFEWQRGSLFALPVNQAYRLLNGSGIKRARLLLATNLPMVMKLYRNEGFVFGSPFDFAERMEDARFGGEGELVPTPWGTDTLWETNFVPDLLAFDKLVGTPGRGGGSTQIKFVLADGTMHAHLSAIPAGEYKKAHRHGDGKHLVQLTGTGYSLYWRDGQQPDTRVDWTYGMLHAPPNDMWHQHFNVGDSEARYLVLSFGSHRYPFFGSTEKREAEQIEYEDEDPRIRKTFEEATSARL